jgi:hypothetical protein
MNADRLIAAIVLGILAAVFAFEGLPVSAGVVAALALLYLWKGPK